MTRKFFKNDKITSEEPVSSARRALLLGAGAAGVAGTVGSVLAPQAAQALSSENVTNAPESEKLHESQAFYGKHQPGIVTPRPAAGLVASFDVLARDRSELERMFRLLTERTEFLMKGGTPPELDAKFPPSDSGILGPVVTPDNLTVTVALGSSLFDDRFGLKPLKPKLLQRMTSFPNDALQKDICHGDLVIQFCSNTPDTNIHALRDIMKNMPDLLMVRWKQEGTVPVQPPHSPKAKESARNFLGFRDGSANPDSSDEALMNRIVWVGEKNAEPDWATNGSYMAVRIIRNFVERWDRTPLQEQEAIFGRRKDSGAPFDGKTETDVPNYAKDADGKITPLDSHIRLANPRDADAEQHLILRRPFNYSNGVSKSGQLDMGLLFIAYQADLEKGFITVQNRLNGEPLEEYLKPIGGGYFFALPGVEDQKDYYARALLEASGPQNARG
ncbi:iron uptake transporter deferrochelatase/peroxidase subunit [Brucella intermedia]|uniref:iron uptake transporter deferrochelatase/peroxidase subunit n=1 Tax=Brucella intermedia TaxID=94625 RepID=UPI00209B1C06|nr:iron uptake transporter deferrochelatase/peroxidase subunit [Brucella intermedia]MCO7736565.1 iron uptake transporter deferrochelatase/peroxidase subunit [Brucella intermedia]WLF99237.1 iron uptake transporter deferrochelatase/peroxidase subunit [Brucella intermedia]